NGGGISFGSTNVLSGWCVNALPQYQNNTLLMRAGNQIELYDAGNVLRGRIYGSSSGLNITASPGEELFLSGSGGVLISGGPTFIATTGTTFTNNVLFSGLTRYDYSTSNTESIYVRS